jgi:hypothetical protein
MPLKRIIKKREYLRSLEKVGMGEKIIRALDTTNYHQSESTKCLYNFCPEEKFNKNLLLAYASRFLIMCKFFHPLPPFPEKKESRPKAGSSKYMGVFHIYLIIP